MQLAQAATGVAATEIVQAVGEVARLLDLEQEDPGPDSVNRSRRIEDHISRGHLELPHESPQGSAPNRLAHLVGPDLAVETPDDSGSRHSLQNEPRLLLAEVAAGSLSLCRKGVVRVHLDRQLRSGVDELREERHLAPVAGDALFP